MDEAEFTAEALGRGDESKSKPENAEGAEKSEAEGLFVRRFRDEAGEKQKLDAEARRRGDHAERNELTVEIEVKIPEG